MKKIVLGILMALITVPSVKAEMLYTAQGQMGFFISRWSQMPHENARYQKNHPPVPPLAPWYTYWPSEAINQPIAPMAYPYWPGANYQAPPANQQGNGQLGAQNHPNYFYYYGSNSYVYPAR